MSSPAPAQVQAEVKQQNETTTSLHVITNTEGSDASAYGRTTTGSITTPLPVTTMSTDPSTTVVSTGTTHTNIVSVSGGSSPTVSPVTPAVGSMVSVEESEPLHTGNNGNKVISVALEHHAISEYQQVQKKSSFVATADKCSKTVLNAALCCSGETVECVDSSWNTAKNIMNNNNYNNKGDENVNVNDGNGDNSNIGNNEGCNNNSDTNSSGNNDSSVAGVAYNNKKNKRRIRESVTALKQVLADAEDLQQQLLEQQQQQRQQHPHEKKQLKKRNSEIIDIAALKGAAEQLQSAEHEMFTHIERIVQLPPPSQQQQQQQLLQLPVGDLLQSFQGQEPALVRYLQRIYGDSDILTDLSQHCDTLQQTRSTVIHLLPTEYVSAVVNMEQLLQRRQLVMTQLTEQWHSLQDMLRQQQQQPEQQQQVDDDVVVGDDDMDGSIRELQRRVHVVEQCVQTLASVDEQAAATAAVASHEQHKQLLEQQQQELQRQLPQQPEEQQQQNHSPPDSAAEATAVLAGSPQHQQQHQQQQESQVPLMVFDEFPHVVASVGSLSLGAFNSLEPWVSAGNGSWTSTDDMIKQTTAATTLQTAVAKRIQTVQQEVDPLMESMDRLHQRLVNGVPVVVVDGRKAKDRMLSCDGDIRSDSTASITCDAGNPVRLLLCLLLLVK